MGSLEQITQVDDLSYWRGEIPVSFAYTMGVAGERFFRELRDNARLLGSRCDACNYTYLPPRLYCERCFAALERWLEVGPRGTVEAVTAAHLDLEGRPLAQPIVLALIRLDGADGLLVHKLGGAKAAEVSIGQRVEPVFQPRRRRQGSILDIRYFRPLVL